MAEKPNLILILCDDLGYGDIEPNGGRIPTPAINQMAKEGLVATDYYAPSNICTPSRAGILTGRYPIRTGLGYEVILHGDDRKLPHTEKTIADALKPVYATGLFGKWHVGHKGPDWLPTTYGFDKFFGIPYSHDIEPLSVFEADAKTGKVTSADADFPNLQQQFYAHAERFIEDNRSRPFFFELALSAPHLPEHPNDAFKGTDKRAGPYGDVVREIDSIVGRLFDKLKQLKLEQNTVVLFTSDNGPWFEGSTGRLRDRKGGAAYDGGYRVPFLAWGPGRIKPCSKTNAIISGIDVLPTFCSLAGINPPRGVEIDGRDITAVLTASAPSPHEEILLFNNEEVVGVRTQDWKYVTHPYLRRLTEDLEEKGFIELYEMKRDLSESYSVAVTYPDVTADMQARIKRARQTFAPFKKGMPPYFKEMLKKGLLKFQD